MLLSCVKPENDTTAAATAAAVFRLFELRKAQKPREAHCIILRLCLVEKVGMHLSLMVAKNNNNTMTARGEKPGDRSARSKCPHGGGIVLASSLGAVG